MKATIPDSELMKISIIDNNEILVDLRNYLDEINFPTYEDFEDEFYEFPNLENFFYLAREKVAQMLVKADQSLPKGYKLKIYSAYRPLSVQKHIYSKFFNEIKNKSPKWTSEEIKKETDKWVAPLELVPPHTTGGTIDLTIITSDRKELDMGSELGSTDKAHFDSEISLIARKNRELLKKVMTKAGFVNYPEEWWHWSYGDRYWAAINKTHSVYGSI